MDTEEKSSCLKCRLYVVALFSKVCYVKRRVIFHEETQLVVLALLSDGWGWGAGNYKYTVKNGK